MTENAQNVDEMEFITLMLEWGAIDAQLVATKVKVIIERVFFSLGTSQI